MIIGSICENKDTEKRISVTPENVKKFISNGFRVYLEKNYANHLDIEDEKFIENGAEFFEDKQKIIKDLNKSSWVDTQSLKKTFKFLDGTKIELGEKEYKTPLLVFYPSGENSGGIIDIYYEEYIQRIVINNNGKINNEVVNY